MDVRTFLQEGEKHYLPNLSIDHVIIGYDVGKLCCLLLKLEGRWILPGGFILRLESVQEAASRILEERTGMVDPHMEFLSVFGGPERQFKDQWKDLSQAAGIQWNEDYWINERFVTLAHYSLVHLPSIEPRIDARFESIQWFDFDTLPDMWLDHQSIATSARELLKEAVLKDPISTHLLPSQFTMPELHQLHEVILKKQVDRSRFQKKMLATGLFERLPKKEQSTPGRNPFLYQRKSTLRTN